MEEHDPREMAREINAGSRTTRLISTINRNTKAVQQLSENLAATITRASRPSWVAILAVIVATASLVWQVAEWLLK